MASSDACIGQRVKVFWSGDDEWYEGEIDDMRGFDYKPPTVEAHVVYRDGEKKWHNLANEQWEQIGQTPQQAVSQQCPFKKKRKLDTPKPVRVCPRCPYLICRGCRDAPTCAEPSRQIRDG